MGMFEQLNDQLLVFSKRGLMKTFFGFTTYIVPTIPLETKNDKKGQYLIMSLWLVLNTYVWVKIEQVKFLCCINNKSNSVYVTESNELKFKFLSAFPFFCVREPSHMTSVLRVFLTYLPTLIRHFTTKAYLVKSYAAWSTYLSKNLTSHVNAPLKYTSFRLFEFFFSTWIVILYGYLI